MAELEPEGGEALDVTRMLKQLGRILWWGLLFLLALPIVIGPLARAMERLRAEPTWIHALEVAEILLGLTLLFIAFWLVWALAGWIWGTVRVVHPAAKETPADEEPSKKSEKRLGYAFPQPVTVATGAWLVLSTLLCLVLLLVAMAAPPWLVALIGDRHGSGLDDLLVTMFAGGVGGSVSAIVAYLKHASEVGDFEQEYVPWYYARPLLGLLLGLIAFFMVKGGLLMTLPETENQDFNNFGLAAVGSLVGLFSKNALEKLKEVFHVVFSSRKQVREETEEEEHGKRGSGDELDPRKDSR